MMRYKVIRGALMMLVLIGATGRAHAQSHASDEPEPRWWKGNLQTQSYWSDGDQLPEAVCAWYKDNGFHFVALSDHDRPPVGEMWKEIGVVDSPDNISAKVHPRIVDQYVEAYGRSWVETRKRDGHTEVRLKPVEEFGPLLNEAQRFLVMPSHQIYTEVKDENGETAWNNPGVAWLDIVNSTTAITATRGDAPANVLQETIRHINHVATASGRQLLVVLSHPNYAWQQTADDIVGVDELLFMEIYTALPSCNSNGDGLRCSAERLWDILLTRRLAELNKPVIYALASDDAHTFQPIPDTPGWGRPGRGWIMVRAKRLTPESLFRAMRRGEFYASSGVTLEDVRYTKEGLTVSIRAKSGVRYTTQYIGTLRGYDPSSEPVSDETGEPLRTTNTYSDDVGRILHESNELTSSYKLKGNEIYVRARVVSDRLHPDPSWDRQTEAAWTQPVIPD